MKDKKELVINLIKSFFVTFAAMNVSRLETANILLVCVFVVSFVLLSYKKIIVGETDKRTRAVSIILATVLAVLYACFADLSGGLSNKAFRAIYVISSVAGLLILFYELILLILAKAAQKKTDKIEINKNSFSLKLFGIYAGIIFICCIPFIALNYPAVMTPDSQVQLRQIINLEPLTNHHPWVHTLTFGLLYKIGFAITKDMCSAIAFYTVFQMIAVAAAVAYTIECMYEMGVGKVWRILALLAFVLYPYNLMYAVTIWKDVLFSMNVLVFTVTLFRVLHKWTLRDKIIFCVSGLGMCFYRHNGFYAYVLTILILLIIKRKEIKNYFVYGIGVLAFVMIVNGPVANALHVKQTSFAFAMTMPLQQIGCVVANDGEIGKEQRAFLETINSVEVMGQLYEPACEDPLLSWATVNDEFYLDEVKGEFIKTWVNLGVHNFGLYVRAFIDQTVGYWAPMAPEQTVFYGITPGYVDGLESRPIIDGPVLIKIDELLSKLYTMIPVYGSLYSMGSCLWLTLLAMASCINKKETKKIIAFLPIILITLSVLAAAPLRADLRYAYQLMVALPYLMAVAYAV